MAKVTVLLYAHDSEAHLREAIQSIQLQSFTDFEFLIVNDGSTDGTAAILDSLGDARVRVLHQSYAGWAISLNRGLEHSRGEYIACMAADAVAQRERLESQVRYLDADPKVAVVASRTRWIDAKRNPIADWQADWKCVKPEQLLAMLPRENCIAHSSMMARAAVLKRFAYSPRAGAGCDYELWLRLASARQVIHKIAEPLVLMRAQESASGKNRSARLLALGWSLRHFRLGHFELELARSLLRGKTVS